jgi:3-hydroxyisobutyrate dehydrogenase-like beta-hydroxyacid dehydrogenase
MGGATTTITAVGLGKMGAALAWALHRAGHAPTVWNRSADKTHPFADAGVATADTLAGAVAASDVVLICIDDYAVTRAAFDTPEIRPLLRGRAIVQLSTGTPRQARDAQAWMTDAGATYLDGAILCGPTDIGTPGGLILLSGAAAAHDRARPVLDCLGGDMRYLGDNPAAASAVDLAWLTNRYGTFLALAHAAALCQSEGVGVEALLAVEAERADIQKYGATLVTGDFHNSTATLGVWGAALERIREQARDAGLNSEFPDFAADLFARAKKAGYADDNVMSLIKVLRG